MKVLGGINTMKKFLTIDTETTGLPGNRKNDSDFREDFSSIDVTQIGMLSSDENFKELESRDLRSRISDDVTPSPESFLTHGDFKSLDEGETAFQMFKRFNIELDKFANINFDLLTYNGAKFDLPVLWANSLKNFQFPYRIQNLADAHIDVVNAVLLATAQHDSFPRVLNHNKNITRQLPIIADLLGISNFNAHDAVADCKMTNAIFEIISRDYHDVFETCFINGDKEKLYSNLRNGMILNEFDDKLYKEKSAPLSRQPLLAIAREGNQALCLDLTVDPDEFFDLSDEELLNNIGFYGSSLMRVVKLNKSLAFAQLKHSDLESFFSISHQLIDNRIKIIKENFKFQGRAARLWKSKSKKNFICLDRPEAQLYASNFFPDENLMNKFNELSDTSLKKETLLTGDHRLQYLGRRLLCLNGEDSLSAEDQKFIEKHIRDRLANNFNFTKEYPKGCNNEEALLHTRIYIKGAQYKGEPISPDKIKGLRKLEKFYERRQKFIDGGIDEQQAAE